MENQGEFVAMKFKSNFVGATSVDWYVGKRCNFDCSYCVDYLHDNSSPHVPLANMKKFVDFVNEKSGSNVLWSLTGGEPTLNPEFESICEYIRLKGSSNISITTNGSRTAKYYIQLFEQLDHITLSLHFEHIAPKSLSYVEKVIQIENWRKKWNEENKANFKKGIARKKTFLVRFMVYPGLFEMIEEMKARFQEANVERVEYRYIRPLSGGANEQMPSKRLEFAQNHDTEKNLSRIHRIGSEIKTRITKHYLQLKYKKFDSKDTPQETLSSGDRLAIKDIVAREENWYSDGEKKKLDEYFSEDNEKKLMLYFEKDGQVVAADYHYNKLNFERKSNFEGWLCWAGIKHMKIAPNGDIYVGSCHVGGKRGNIYEIEKGIDMPEKPLRCPKWRCTDHLDLRVPKIKDWKYYAQVETAVGGVEKVAPTQHV